MKKILTFTSDFGYLDPYTGEVKGVINACEPEATVIDITHGIEPGNLTSAAFVLLNSYRYFQTGTVHLAVIDPGVGSERDIIAVRTRGYTFIAPDNGVLYETVNEDGIKEIYALDTDVFLKKIGQVYTGSGVIGRILKEGVSHVFHGRDLFAPLAGYVLGGGSLKDVAQEKPSIVKLEVMNPVLKGDKIRGRVVYIDRFGNLITNIKAGLLSPGYEIFLKTGESVTAVGSMKKTYSLVDPGSFLPLIGSRGCLEIAVNRGSASNYFNARCGDEVLIIKQADRQ